VRTVLARHRPWPLDPAQLDRVIAVLLVVLGELQVWAGDVRGGDRLLAALLVPLLAATVAVRRRFPTLAGAVAGVTTGLLVALHGDPQVLSNAIALLCALYALAVWSAPRPFVLGLAAITLADLAPGSNFGSRVSWALGSLAAVLIVRRVVRDRDQRAELAERDRDLAALEAVVDERARIARELHDVVAHSVSVMVVQAQAGPRLVDDPVQASGVFASIEATGREALVELRRLLGVLRTADEQLAIGPQPGLGSLDSLVDQMRAAGLPVVLRVEGEAKVLPPGVDLSAYRIVQEALTNALKHAGEAEAEVVVRYAANAVELEVVDNGLGGGDGLNGAGHGLVGMRERVALYGGVLEAGTRNGHGYAVRARLPFGGAPRA
jgi:signal transduction histidine kinase